MKALALLALFTCIPVHAQTIASKVSPVKSKALLKAEARIKVLEDIYDGVSGDNERLNRELTGAMDAHLKTFGEALYNGSLIDVLDREINGKPLTDDDKAELALAASPNEESLKSAIDIENQVNAGIALIKKLTEENAALTEKYNGLLATAKANSEQTDLLVRQMSAQLNLQAQQAAIAQQMRVANALAIYSLLPRYNAPQYPIYQIPAPTAIQHQYTPPININCTSRAYTGEVQTNCQQQ